MERNYDLKLANGKVVTWSGENWEDAINRYQDAHPYTSCHTDAAVIAWKPAGTTGIFPGVSARQIIG